jgi:hypothetical protein
VFLLRRFRKIIFRWYTAFLADNTPYWSIILRTKMLDLPVLYCGGLWNQKDTIRTGISSHPWVKVLAKTHNRWSFKDSEPNPHALSSAYHQWVQSVAHPLDSAYPLIRNEDPSIAPPFDTVLAGGEGLGFGELARCRAVEAAARFIETWILVCRRPV